MDLSSRLNAAECLDAAEHDVAQLEVTLDHLVDVNRWLGGSRVVLAHLAKWLPAEAAARVLDVGTGAGDIPRAVARWAAKRGRVVDICAVDLRSVIARQARNRCRAEPSIRVLAADGMELPFACNTFDVAISSMTLHHLDDSRAHRFVAELARVAACAVVINDLERHLINYIGARVLAATAWRRDPYTRHDGPVSVLRSFTVRELHGVGKRAGLRNVRVHRHFPYRLALIGQPS